MKRPRGLVAGFLLAASLVGATTAHRHSILEDASSTRPEAPQLDPRCALSTALSIHAIPRIVERDTCWACHWHRLFAVSAGEVLAEPVDSGQVRISPPPRAAENVACFTRLSRGPPSLL